MDFLEQVFFLIAFCTGFVGLLVTGIVLHDWIDRRRFKWWLKWTR